MTTLKNFLPACLKCGAWCCKHASPIVLPEEREKIVKFSGKGYFKRIDDYFFIPHPCGYLSNDNKCTIHEVKPLDCEAFPLGIFINENGKLEIGVSPNCPARNNLTDIDTKEAKRLLKKLIGKGKGLDEFCKRHGLKFEKL